jgi:hypothetical protein
VRKQIVATTEGGAITGEERLREHTDQLYGALLTYEGKPTAYQQDNIVALEAELTRIQHAFEALTGQNLATLNRKLTGAGITPITMKPADSDEEDDADEDSANPHAGKADPDALMERQRIPVDFRPLRQRYGSRNGLPSLGARRRAVRNGKFEHGPERCPGHAVMCLVFEYTQLNLIAVCAP